MSPASTWGRFGVKNWLQAPLCHHWLLIVTQLGGQSDLKPRNEPKSALRRWKKVPIIYDLFKFSGLLWCSLEPSLT